MGYYKIKSITNTLPKRDVNKDRVLNIEYNVGFTKKGHQLSAGGEMLISCTNLPTQLQSLRLKKLITISQISEIEFEKGQKPKALKKNEIKNIPLDVKKDDVVENSSVEDDESKKSGRKKSTTKDSE